MPLQKDPPTLLQVLIFSIVFPNTDERSPWGVGNENFKCNFHLRFKFGPLEPTAFLRTFHAKNI